MDVAKRFADKKKPARERVEPKPSVPVNARQQSLRREVVPPKKTTTIAVKKPVQRGVSVPIRRR